MITLSELVSKVERAPLTREKRAPGWRQLRKYGGGIVERAVFDDESFLEVFRKGYVYYKSGTRRTTFSLADVLEDYEYRPQQTVPDAAVVFDETCFSELPWVIRVLMEGEDRVESNQDKSRTEMYSVSFDTTCDDYGTFGFDEDDPLTLLLQAEFAEMLYQSFLMMTEYQQRIFESCVLNDRKHWEVADELEVTRQSVTRTLQRGLKSFRESFEKIYGSDKKTEI